MRPLRWSLFGLLMVFWAVPLIAADGEADSLIKRMMNAVQGINYEGIFVYIQDHGVETMQIMHGVDDGVVRERLVTLSGDPRELVREGDVLLCMRRDSSGPCMEPRKTLQGLPGVVPMREYEAPVRRYYRVRLGETWRVANWHCRVVHIQPRDELRYGHRLCVHEESGMLLKSQLLTPAGQVLEQFMFTQLSFAEHIPAERFAPTLMSDRGEVMHWQEPAADDRVESMPTQWRIRELPRGFELTQATRRQMPGETHPVEHLLLSDGMASVSVFVVQVDQPRDLLVGMTRAGAMHALARPHEDHQITILGEVPAATMQMIAENIYRESADD
ncbi:sigma E regulatory protein, MucB/RseB [Ectothiorhodosinus mongolicus]|uniref:Sigma E regulatory protein, MucB/RseB n=1 Tax=Ectothiorhodosinus mongolicus TaxID=233100 RepID=A0A1R3VRZ5_9GAMM|nr:MucB/RseB C-terminal domain-containing protein [Ectothiorhodosinus mongolicus]ULX56384.1 transcriptional regulator [Ectothiorhodosinus mongolicus]SIT65902.1 sigma E regulatory protein, MucB/RseB [Ectothiorhodosinus mongolicus]